jgi:hypothetical protein
VQHRRWPLETFTLHQNDRCLSSLVTLDTGSCRAETACIILELLPECKAEHSHIQPGHRSIDIPDTPCNPGSLFRLNFWKLGASLVSLLSKNGKIIAKTAKCSSYRTGLTGKRLTCDHSTLRYPCPIPQSDCTALRVERLKCCARSACDGRSR